MEMLRGIADLRETIWRLGIRHIQLVFIAVVISTVLGVALGIMVSRHRGAGRAVVALANIGQAVPSLAILGLVIPFLGIGATPTVFALVLRGTLPILNNTFAGLVTVDRGAVDAGRGMGMRGWQVLTMIEVPLAFPVIMAGIRSATVVSISLATIAALIGAGGLGDLIYQGLAMVDATRLLAGSIPVALMAIAADSLLGWAERASAARSAGRAPRLGRRDSRAYAVMRQS